jgi:hypothetical protein
MTAKNLITVLLINNAITVPIIGMPKQRQHPQKQAR